MTDYRGILEGAIISEASLYDPPVDVVSGVRSDIALVTLCGVFMNDGTVMFRNGGEKPPGPMGPGLPANITSFLDDLHAWKYPLNPRVGLTIESLSGPGMSGWFLVNFSIMDFQDARQN